MANNGNVVNVNKLMHEYCKSKVSPDAVKELSSRIVDKLYNVAPDLDRIAKKYDRKTVMESDVIELFSLIDMDVV